MTAAQPITTIKFKTIANSTAFPWNATSTNAFVPKVKPALAPIRLTAVTNEPVDIIGGKAASLVRLMKQGFTVPDAWVIPCVYSIKRPEAVNLDVIISYLGSGTMLAVRSGAPVSMPGLLQTRLNVTRKDLMEAVTAVWDSWNTDHAKAYREAKGLDNSMGTAVIIQQMVANVKKAGVAFTADPSCPDKSWEFNPVIEYVEGLGDKLVGGEAQPTKAMPGDEVYSALEADLEKMHDEFGPSDVEWCIDKYGQVWYVQQRAVKFAAATGGETIEGEAVASGRPIGAPVNITGKIVKSASYAEGNILYIVDFKPELYEPMMKAKAILCQHGGATCHASIIGREMGKPAISGLGEDFINLWNKKMVTLEGTTGKVYEAKKEEIEAAKAAAANITVETVLDETRCPKLGYTKLTANNAVNVNLMLVRFYSTQDKFTRGEITQEQRDKIVDEIAEILGTYFFVATCCEARHAYSCCDYSADKMKLIEQLAKLGLCIPDKEEDETSGDRAKFVKMYIPQPESVQHALEIQRLITRLYKECKWRSSYGGPRWGTISELVESYLEGKRSKTLFVDAAFNMRHNGGLAFDKFHWLNCDNSLLTSQLNVKTKYSIKRLIERTASSYGYSTEEVQKSSERERFVEIEVPVIKANETAGGKKPDKLDPNPTEVSKVTGEAGVNVKAVKYEFDPLTLKPSKRDKYKFVLTGVTYGAVKYTRKEKHAEVSAA
jgi:phosphohistidine swiveling domain-containing protein